MTYETPCPTKQPIMASEIGAIRAHRDMVDRQIALAAARAKRDISIPDFKPSER